MNNIFKKFSESLRKVLVLSEKNALEQNAFLDTEHQLAALTIYEDSLANEILASFGVTPDRVQLMSSLLSKKRSAIGDKITSDAKKAVQLAVQYAAELGHFNIEPEHLLLALISDKSFNSYLIVERIGVKPTVLKTKLESVLLSLDKKLVDSKTTYEQPEMMIPDEMADGIDFMGSLGQAGMPLGRQAQTQQKNESFLDSFTTNLTKLAKSNELDPVIGRSKEIDQLVQILCRRTKNNPVLIGEPGVGKTSIVEGLVSRIIEGKVPEKLLDAEVLSLDIGSILAGTMYRGQFESRIKKILAEVKKKGNIILFADEIHMLVGAGSTEGSIDAANLLKPMLARGELKMIGSTTFDEYKKHIEKDSAFERRLQPVIVNEPTVEETVEILKGIKEKYEQFHHVVYSDKSLNAAANLAKRYINDRFLPDKAIDLIDEAGAATYKVKTESQKLIVLKNKLSTLSKSKNQLLHDEKYEEATLLRQKELKINAEITKLSAPTTDAAEITISEDDIAAIISKWTGIPAKSLTAAEKKKYLSIDTLLKKHIIGQDEAISEVAKALKRRRVGISNPNKPIGSFIFLGPTGVGKTELAKVLAREIYGSEKALIKIDMSEFMEKHNVSRLVGAPAGYVGYEEGGKLTEIVRKNPYSIILLDEIEKAHPEVFNILLQIMDEGTLTDARGRKVDFKNTILILTSNLGTDIIRKQFSIGFANDGDKPAHYSKLKENILENVEKNFRPEFINRLDKIVIFYQLDKKSIRKIVDLQITELEKRLLLQSYKMIITDETKDYIAEKSFSTEYGARPVKKYIADHLELAISEAILKEKYNTGDTISILIKNNKLSLS